MTTPGRARFTLPDGTVHDFTVEIARQPTDRARGLLGRDANFSGLVGMVFEFNPPNGAAMSTRGMKIPIDIVFVLPSSEVALVDHAPANSGVYTSGHLVRWVVELPGDTASKLGIVPGARFSLAG